MNYTVRLLYKYCCVLDKNASISSAHLAGGVTNSMSDSEKSVVMFGCVKAQPSALGCGA
jgi:hypothetical protein